MKKLLLCLFFVMFFGVAGCQSVPEIADNEPMICFEMRYVADANKGNHDKYVLSDLIRECVNQCKDIHANSKKLDK